MPAGEAVFSIEVDGLVIVQLNPDMDLSRITLVRFFPCPLDQLAPYTLRPIVLRNNYILDDRDG